MLSPFQDESHENLKALTRPTMEIDNQTAVASSTQGKRVVSGLGRLVGPQEWAACFPSPACLVVLIGYFKEGGVDEPLSLFGFCFPSFPADIHSGSCEPPWPFASIYVRAHFDCVFFRMG